MWDIVLGEHLDPAQRLICVEVGSFEGRSTMFLADYLLSNNDSVMYCVDNWLGGEEIARTNLPYNMKNVEDNFDYNVGINTHRAQIHKMKGDSESQLLNLLQHLKQHVDFVYVDGSHTQRDTLVDVTLSLLLVRSGGVILIDDYMNPMATTNRKLRPQDAVDFISTTFEDEASFTALPNGQALFIKR